MIIDRCTSLRLLEISAPELREESFVNQFLNNAVVEKLLGLRGFRFRVAARNFVESYLKSGALDERNLFHELIAILEASLEHFLILDLGVFGEDRQRFRLPIEEKVHRLAVSP